MRRLSIATTESRRISWSYNGNRSYGVEVSYNQTRIFFISYSFVTLGRLITNYEILVIRFSKYVFSRLASSEQLFKNIHHYLRATNGGTFLKTSMIIVRDENVSLRRERKYLIKYLLRMKDLNAEWFVSNSAVRNSTKLPTLQNVINKSIDLQKLTTMNSPYQHISNRHHLSERKIHRPITF